METSWSNQVGVKLTTQVKHAKKANVVQIQCVVNQTEPVWWKYVEKTFLSCLYTNADSLDIKQEEWEIFIDTKTFDIIGITETWENDPHG